MYFLHFQVGETNVDTALSLVGYEDELETAMKFVFGSSFVAADLNSAKKVTLIFHYLFPMGKIDKNPLLNKFSSL